MEGRADAIRPPAHLGTAIALCSVAQGRASTSLRSIVSQARLGAPPCIRSRGARNVARPIASTSSLEVQ